MKKEYVVIDQKNRTIRKFRAENIKEAEEHVLSFARMVVMAAEFIEGKEEDLAIEDYEKLGLYEKDGD